MNSGDDFDARQFDWRSECGQTIRLTGAQLRVYDAINKAFPGARVIEVRDLREEGQDDEREQA